ncbi:MAG: fimbrillin family protein, partial [Muribaculaceae bacterium]|nr:fimbrillin family protein [Muribaculaceae bacterium]
SNEGIIAQPKLAEGEIPNPENPGVSVANKKVGFNFRHILTKVNAVFSTDFPKEYQVEISNAKMVNVVNVGTYSPKTIPVWTDVVRDHANAEVNLVIDPNNKIASSVVTDGVAQSVTSGSAVVIPCNYEANNAGAVQLKFDIDIYRDGEKILDRTLVGTWSPNWESGYSYTYNITISGTTTDLDPIVFETKEGMNVGGWTSTSGANINFHTNTNN